MGNVALVCRDIDITVSIHAFAVLLCVLASHCVCVGVEDSPGCYRPAELGDRSVKQVFWARKEERTETHREGDVRLLVKLVVVVSRCVLNNITVRMKVFVGMVWYLMFFFRRLYLLRCPLLLRSLISCGTFAVCLWVYCADVWASVHAGWCERGE